MCLGFEETARLRFVLIDAEMRQSERAKEPAPDRPLMIGRVAFARAAAVMSGVAGVVWTEATQTERREQFPFAGIYDGFLLFERKRTHRQRDGEDLIRAEQSVVADAW